MASVTAFKNRRTPGVYITELDAFPPSIVGVQTAVPAFIGYTEKATISGKPVLNQPIKIGSLVDFETIFGKGYKPVYTFVDVTDPIKINAGHFDFKVFDSANKAWKYYDFVQKTDTKFNLYNSMRLFYANGGGNCYVVSVGTYLKQDGTPDKVTLAPLLGGLDVIKEQVGPTMLVVPEGVLLPSSGGEVYKSADFEILVKGMLKQCRELQDRVAVLDVYGSDTINNASVTLEKVIDQFHTDVGSESLNYGMAYFPFLHTTVVPLSEIAYTNIDIDDCDTAGKGKLQEILKFQADNLYPDPAAPRAKAVLEDINKIDKVDVKPEFAEKVITLNQNLAAALPLLTEMERVILMKNDVLPPSGAMAGVITYIDGTRGVWNAPANITLVAVPNTTYKLNNLQQGDMNLPVNGKAICALREFVGRGTVVWGARTLDGNSNDWRYIQVRRTLIFIEQSIKSALDKFVFTKNDGTVWTAVNSMVSGFLQGVWSQGGLMGATASEAFSVECGIGSTMTAQDLLSGYMIVQVTLQMQRPAEFIELTFKQKMDI